MVESLASDLRRIGVRSAGMLLVHSSLRALGPLPNGPQTIITALKMAVGPEGHLLFPALSYQHVDRESPCFHWKNTPSNVGALPEWFRQQVDTQRSIHPTHSVAGQGPNIQALLSGHDQDHTPCGPNSPFHRLREWRGQILMLGCGLRPNTSMHAIEELVAPSYLYDPLPYPIEIHGPEGSVTNMYRPHDFHGWVQRYDRIGYLMYGHSGLRSGKVGRAKALLLEAPALWEVALKALKKDPLFFVDALD